MKIITADGKAKMSQREFWSLPEVKAQQAIQQQSRYGTKAHRDANNEIARLAIELAGVDFEDTY